MKPYIQISIRTKTETTGCGVGERLIDSLNLGGGLLAPEQVSHNADKFTMPFVGKAKSVGVWATKAAIRVNGFLAEFHQDFAWRRKKKIKSSGIVVHTSRNLRGQVVPGAVRMNSAYSEKIDWYSIFKGWCEIFPPQLGMLHYFTEPELQLHMVHDSFQIGSFNAALKPDVPNAGWAMFYGNEFAEKVDVKRIAKAGFPVEKIGDGYLVRVTEDIQDVVRNFSLFAQRRTELKSLFPDGFFLD